jgi:hypothetical protein
MKRESERGSMPSTVRASKLECLLQYCTVRKRQQCYTYRRYASLASRSRHWCLASIRREAKLNGIRLDDISVHVYLCVRVARSSWVTTAQLSSDLVETASRNCVVLKYFILVTQNCTFAHGRLNLLVGYDSRSIYSCLGKIYLLPCLV